MILFVTIFTALFVLVIGTVIAVTKDVLEE